MAVSWNGLNVSALRVSWLIRPFRVSKGVISGSVVDEGRVERDEDGTDNEAGVRDDEGL